MSKKQESKPKKKAPSTKGKSKGLDVGALNEAFLKSGCQRSTIALLKTGSLRPKPLATPVRQVIEEVIPIAPPISRLKLRKQYKNRVWKLTNEQPLQLLANIEKRALKGWHIDHVLSVFEGFKRNLPPESIAHISNLRMIPAQENYNKGIKTVFTDLFNNVRI